MKLLYAFSSLLLLFNLVGAQVRIGGSDLLAEDFAAALSAHAESLGIDAEIGFDGSYSAMSGLKEGTIDFAIVAVPDGTELPGEPFRSEYVGAKVLTVAVAGTNPLSEINLSQLAGVFGASAAVNIGRWGELGLTGEWTTRPILLTSISGAAHSLALDLFRHVALNGGNLKTTVEQRDTIGAIRVRLQEMENGIALLHRLPGDPGSLKILSIASSPTALAHAPTPEAVAAKDYPLRLPLYLVFSADKAAELGDLLRFAVSDEAAEILEEIGLTPLSEVGRQRLSFEFGR